MTNETLGYVCKTTTTRHGRKGVKYRHRWATGAQDLIFATHETAREWARINRCKFTGPTT